MLEGVPTKEIISQNHEKQIAAYMLLHNMDDRSAALSQMAEAGVGRDFDLSPQDVANIRMQADQQTWRRAANEQESVLRWAAQHGDDLLYVHEQKPIEGTPDHEHLQHVAATRAAAARQAALHRKKPLEETCDSESLAAPGGADGEQLSAAGGAADGLAEQPGGDATLEPAFHGCDDDLDKPQHISLNRECAPQQAVPAFVDWDPSMFNPLNWEPFSIAFMAGGGLTAAKRLGHQRSLQLDSTFGCNKQKFPVFTLMAVDEQHHGVPLAFLICSQERTDHPGVLGGRRNAGGPPVYPQ